MRAGRIGRAALLSAAVLLSGCEGPDLGIPWDFERMLEQPRDEAYGETPLFADRRAMRTPPPGTVARAGPGARPRPRDAAPERGAGIPLAGPRAVAPGSAPAPTSALLARGRDRFGIACAPCHGLDGHAQTPVAMVMRLRPPPSLHQERLRALAPAAIAGVISHGYGLMPSYAQLLDPREVWAVAWYVKALQRAERTRLADLPPALRRRALDALEDAR